MKAHKFVLPFFAILAPSVAHAHVGTGETGEFLHGFGHPLGGLDHLCAIVAVGLWAAQMRGHAIWAVPLSFVSLMVLGGALGMMAIPLPLVEAGVIASVLILGVLVLAVTRVRRRRRSRAVA